MDGKSFEDLAFQVISTISPLKIPRDEIPFDAVRELVLNELTSGKKRDLEEDGSDKCASKGKSRRKIEFEDMDELESTSSSSHLAQTDDEIVNGEGGAISRYTSTEIEFDDESSNTARTNSLKLFGNRSSVLSSSSSTLQHTPSSPALCLVETSEKKRPSTYRERRLAEMRQARINNYRGDVTITEFKCEETILVEEFREYYWKLMNDSDVTVPNAFFCLVENLDAYFRTRTWDSNCAKLCSEFLTKSIYQTCQQLTESHDAKDANDELRIKELMIQVLVGLYSFSFKLDKALLDDAINKLRLIYITSDPQTMRTFLEEPVTDIFLDTIAESIATIYDELCITLPADLAQFDTGFKMNDIDDSVLGKRRNGQASKLEQMLAETAGEIGISNVEKKPELKRGFKRKSEIEQEHCSPRRRVKQTSFKQFFAEDTPNEKYLKKEVEEEIDEVVQQTPMAKLRMSANKSGRRCSRRLSELVKVSEERSQIPRKARESVEKLLEKAKAATPLRSARRTPRSVLFANNTPSPQSSSHRSSRASLTSRFSLCSSRPCTSNNSTPLGVRRSSIRVQNGMKETSRESSYDGKRLNGNDGKIRLRIKQESIDEEYDEKVGKSQKSGEWSDRRLRSELGLTRDDLNRYRTAMLAMGMKNSSTEASGTNRKKNLENVQINRAGRVKGGFADEDGVPLFGIKRQSISIFMSHVLLNDANPDISFDWSKVNFDDALNNKPRTRSVQSLIMKPHEYMETLKRKYIESKSTSCSPLKRSKMNLSNGSPRKKTSSIKRSKSTIINESNSDSRRSCSMKFEEDLFDEYGFEPEAF